MSNNATFLAQAGLLNEDAPTLAELATASDRIIRLGQCTTCTYTTQNKGVDWCPKCKSALLWRKINMKDKRRHYSKLAWSPVTLEEIEDL